MNSSSEDSDSPFIDEKTGLPIILLGSNQPVPKITYSGTVRIDPARKRPRSYRRKKAKENREKEVTRDKESRRRESGNGDENNDVVATNLPIQTMGTAAVATTADVNDDVDDDGELPVSLQSVAVCN